MSESPFLSQALLIVGNPESTRPHALKVIRQALCKQQGCNQCALCQMDTLPHHVALWITPEKKYTLDLLEPIAHKIGFTLDPEDHFFFVLEKAELLTPACANSLLKMVEEPPQGYHFLFLASQPQLVIPTIRSRCHVVHTSQTSRATASGFLRHFMGQTSSPVLFLKDLQTDCPEDFETPECLDVLLKHWSEQYTTYLLAGASQEAETTRAMIDLLQKATQKTPMPGSAKLFWRDLFMRKEYIV